MVFAADHPSMDVFWTILVFFAFVAWLFVVNHHGLAVRLVSDTHVTQTKVIA